MFIEEEEYSYRRLIAALDPQAVEIIGCLAGRRLQDNDNQKQFA
jgi:hypothetical protein